MSEIKLLPCPFCGGEAEVLERRDPQGRPVFTVICVCGCGINYYTKPQQAIKQWNTRKPMERIIERICNVRNNTPSTDFKNGCNASLHQIHREIDIDVKEEGGIE